MPKSDLTFFTNNPSQPESSLQARLESLLAKTQSFDIVVGFFYLSGFHRLAKSLSGVSHIRILVGMALDSEAMRAWTSRRTKASSDALSKEVAENLARAIAADVQSSGDSPQIADSFQVFSEWVSAGKVELRVYPEKNLHAKVYIMTFAEDDRDQGRVITGSSNLTQAGLNDNVEFNVELKGSADYEFCKERFEELWTRAVAPTGDYVLDIHNKTFLRSDVTPRDIFLKFLLQHFEARLSVHDELQQQELFEKGMEPFAYQLDAVVQAKEIVALMDGVFIADVTGSGKTLLAGLLARELTKTDGGLNLVIASPRLLIQDTPGGWRDTFAQLGMSNETRVRYWSTGDIDGLLRQPWLDQVAHVFIDECHVFRNGETATYASLAEVCRGRKVVLISATPYNNRPMDIYYELALFQNPRRSKIRGHMNLHQYFTGLQSRLNRIDRRTDPDLYVDTAKQIAREIRTEVLEQVMIRRRRDELTKYWGKDLAARNVSFPTVLDPEAVSYVLDDATSRIFTETVGVLKGRMTYARYAPLLHLRARPNDNLTLQSQVNLAAFMKSLMVKRLESSFEAFRKTLDHVARSYELFLEEVLKRKQVLLASEMSAARLLDTIEGGDLDEIDRLVREGQIDRYPLKDFDDDLIPDLQSDYRLLQSLQARWGSVSGDPKLDAFQQELRDIFAKDSAARIVVFSEAKDTVMYLSENLDEDLAHMALVYHGDASAEARVAALSAFDPAYSRNQRSNPCDRFRILLSTDVLSEGVNLNRARYVINYDIPWNPTHLQQRVGRVNRVSANIGDIHNLICFPASEVDAEAGLLSNVEAKIAAAFKMLGSDMRLLFPDEETEAEGQLFETIRNAVQDDGDGDENPEVRYFALIRDIQENDPDLFDRIKALPSKCRVSVGEEGQLTPELVTYFRKGAYEEYIASESSTGGKGQLIASRTLSFLDTAAVLEKSAEKLALPHMPADYFALYEQNEQRFANDLLVLSGQRQYSTETEVVRGREKKLVGELRYVFLNFHKQLTDDDCVYVEQLTRLVLDGGVPGDILKRVCEFIPDAADPIHARERLGRIRATVPARLFSLAEGARSLTSDSVPKEVILSEYLVPGDGR